MWRPVPGRDYIGNNTPGKPFTGQKSLPRGSRDPSQAKVGRNETESDYFLRFLSNRSPIESSFLPRYPDIRRRRKGGGIKQTKEEPSFPRHHSFHVASYSCGSVCGWGRTSSCFGCLLSTPSGRNRLPAYVAHLECLHTHLPLVAR